MGKLNAIKPRKKEAGFYEVSLSNKDFLGRIQYVLPLGIDAFDMVTGGIPFGRITEIYGLDACGKTALALRAAVRAQQKMIFEQCEDGTLKKVKNPKVEVLYVDNEQSLDEGEKIVVDGVKLDCILSRCDTLDQLFKMIDASIKEIAKYGKDEDKPFLVIIVDTIASTSSKEEMTREWGKDDYSRQPKQLRGAFRRLMRDVSRQNVCVICTNQVSDNFKAVKTGRGYHPSNLPQESDYTVFGGKAIRYYARLRIFMYLVSERYKLAKDRKVSSGFVSGIYTRKNAQRWPSRDGRMVLIYGEGWNNKYSILEQLTLYKLAEVDDDGDVEFFFKKNGVKCTTFGNKESSLEDDDDNEGKKSKKEKNPVLIGGRASWLAFYDAHKADIDALWEALRGIMFTKHGDLRGEGEVVPDDSEGIDSSDLVDSDKDTED